MLPSKLALLKTQATTICVHTTIGLWNGMLEQNVRMKPTPLTTSTTTTKKTKDTGAPVTTTVAKTVLL